ncbi:MAG: hypothetical protein ACRDQ0_05840, partial [Pseudonocardia sp.]
MTERLPTDVVEARLNHLIDRARRGALLPEEADRFTTELRDLVRRLEDTEDERDGYRDRAEGAEAARDRLLRSRDRQAARAKTAAARVTELETAIEQAELDAEQQARHFRTICGERESYRQAWKYEQKHRATAEARVRELETVVARLRQAVDHGPVGSC